MTKQKEKFKPYFDFGKKDFVGIYSCGPTVYREPHIGNMRSYHFADLLKNTIKKILGYPTKHVVNLTDVGHLTSDGDTGEDKMEKGAKKEKISVRDLAEKYINEFKNNTKLLNIDDFDYLPRATDHIQEQIDMVKILEKKGFVYKIKNDGIYMDTSKIDDYGKLSNLGKNIKQGARIENDNKKNATDFALWKFTPKGTTRQMERESPRGVGFPGWHLECSAMAIKYLGDQFDIHTGGIDHIPVHHTNEIAQSECSYGKKPWVKYRMHNQFLNLGGKKMAKSSGGITTIKKLIEKGFDPLDLRYLFFTGHYRSFLDFSEDLLKQSQNSRKSLKSKLSNQKYIQYDGSDYKNIQNQIKKEESKIFFNNCINSIFDDLNTPELLANINKGLSNPNKEIIGLTKYIDDTILKLNLFEKEKKEPIPQEIEELAKNRLSAKKQKNYQLADKLRNEIKNHGYSIKDTQDGFEISKI